MSLRSGRPRDFYFRLLRHRWAHQGAVLGRQGDGPLRPFRENPSVPDTAMTVRQQRVPKYVPYRENDRIAGADPVTGATSVETSVVTRNPSFATPRPPPAHSVMTERGLDGAAACARLGAAAQRGHGSTPGNLSPSLLGQHYAGLRKRRDTGTQYSPFKKATTLMRRRKSCLSCSFELA